MKLPSGALCRCCRVTPRVSSSLGSPLHVIGLYASCLFGSAAPHEILVPPSLFLICNLTCMLQREQRSWSTSCWAGLLSGQRWLLSVALQHRPITTPSCLNLDEFSIIQHGALGRRYGPSPLFRAQLRSWTTPSSPAYAGEWVEGHGTCDLIVRHVFHLHRFPRDMVLEWRPSLPHIS